VTHAAVAVPAAAFGPDAGAGPVRAGGRARAALLAAALSVAAGLAGVVAPAGPARATGSAVPRVPEPPAPLIAEWPEPDAGFDAGFGPDVWEGAAGSAARPEEQAAPRPGAATAEEPAAGDAKAGDAKAGDAKAGDAKAKGSAKAGEAAKAKDTAKAKRARKLSMRYSVPVRIRIPSIKVNAPLMKLGVDRKGRLQTPPLSKPGVAGWYVGSVTPGQIGPAVVVGHMDTRTGPAVFYRLRQLKMGALIYVDRRDGSTAVFKARKRIRVPKTKFPTDKVYGDIGNAGLRLITCGGAFDNRTRHYKDNVIVFARLVKAINHRSA